MKRVVVLVLILFVCVPLASAAVYTTDPAVSAGLKYDTEPGLLDVLWQVLTGKQVAEKPVPVESVVNLLPMRPRQPMERVNNDGAINVLTINNGTAAYEKILQTYSQSDVVVDAASKHETNIMQISSAPGSPALEIYWGYQRSIFDPWVYYMRVNSLNDNYTVLSEYGRGVWKKPISPTRVRDIINSGVIPDWGSL